MENKARYTLVGLFLLIFITACAAFLLWQARYNVEDENVREYRIYSKESIAGLNENSFVQYKGLNIGVVETMRIDPKNLEQIEIILKIDEPQIIKEDSYALIQSQGITGNKNVEINGGSESSKPLSAGDAPYAVIPLKLSFLDKISSDAKNITQKVDGALSRANMLLDEKNLKNIETILENLSKTTANFNKLVAKLNGTVEQSLEKNMKNMEIMTQRMNLLLEKDVPLTLEGVNSFTKQWGDLSKELGKFVQNDLKNLVEKADTSLDGANNIDGVLINLENTLKKVDNTLDGLKENGGNMIFNTREMQYGPGER